MSVYEYFCLIKFQTRSLHFCWNWIPPFAYHDSLGCLSLYVFIYQKCLFLSVVRERFLNDTVWKVSVFGVFLIRFFLHSDRIQRDTEYLSVISLNSGKYGSQKHQIRTLFGYCDLQWLLGLTIKLYLHVAQPCRFFWYKLFISSISISCEKLGFLVYY